MTRLPNIPAAVTQALSVYYGRHRDVILRHARRPIASFIAACWAVNHIMTPPPCLPLLVIS